MIKLKYRPEIDGLRAIAVISVMLFHAGFSTFRGGFLGVDVFFVISGFLITKIILNDVNTGKFTFSNFYRRRARRILPALFFVILICMPLAWTSMLPLEFSAFSTSVVSVILFGSNFLFWRHVSYFNADTSVMPLIHTWSLSVEEQYYLVFPIIIIFLLRINPNRLTVSLRVIALLSFALSLYASEYHSSANFYMLPTRAWEILMGSLCAFASPQLRHLRNQTLSAIGLATIIGSMLAYDAKMINIAIYTLLPVLGTCAIILFAEKRTLVTMVLSQKLVVGIGLISYSTYLWHQPLFAFARLRSLNEPSWQFMMSLMITSLILGWLTWKFLELPMRSSNASAFRNQDSFFIYFGILALAFIAMGILGRVTAGLPSRLPIDVLEIAQFTDSRNPRIACLIHPGEDFSIKESRTYGNSQAVHFALVGDSHAHAIAYELGRDLTDAGLGMKEFTHAGCPPIYSYSWKYDEKTYNCGNYHRKFIEFLSDQHDISTIILFSRWTRYLEISSFNNLEGGVEPTSSDGEKSNDSIDIKIEIGKAYVDSIDALLTKGYKVVLIYPQPEVGWNVPKYLAKNLLFDLSTTRPLTTSYKVFKDRTRQTYGALDKIPDSRNLIRIYPEAIFCNTFVKDRCAADDGNSPFYFDDDHVNGIGASLISQEVMSAMRKNGWID